MSTTTRNYLMFETFKIAQELRNLTTVTALRISAGRSMKPIGSDLPVIKDALGRPLIPGSSFKGHLRSRLKASYVALIQVFANPAVESEWSITPSRMSGF